MKKSLTNISLRAKITGGISFLVFLTFSISFTAWGLLASINNELSNIVENDMPLIKHLTNVTEYQLEQSIHLEKAIRHGLLLQKKNKRKITIQNMKTSTQKYIHLTL